MADIMADIADVSHHHHEEQQQQMQEEDNQQQEEQQQQVEMAVNGKVPFDLLRVDSGVDSTSTPAVSSGHKHQHQPQHEQPPHHAHTNHADDIDISSNKVTLTNGSESTEESTASPDHTDSVTSIHHSPSHQAADELTVTESISIKRTTTTTATTTTITSTSTATLTHHQDSSTTDSIDIPTSLSQIQPEETAQSKPSEIVKDPLARTLVVDSVTTDFKAPPPSSLLDLDASNLAATSSDQATTIPEVQQQVSENDSSTNLMAFVSSDAVEEVTPSTTDETDAGVVEQTETESQAVNQDHPQQQHSEIQTIDAEHPVLVASVTGASVIGSFGLDVTPSVGEFMAEAVSVAKEEDEVVGMAPAAETSKAIVPVDVVLGTGATGEAVVVVAEAAQAEEEDVDVDKDVAPGQPSHAFGGAGSNSLSSGRVGGDVVIEDDEDEDEPEEEMDDDDEGVVGDDEAMDGGDEDDEDDDLIGDDEYEIIEDDDLDGEGNKEADGDGSKDSGNVNETTTLLASAVDSASTVGTGRPPTVLEEVWLSIFEPGMNSRVVMVMDICFYCLFASLFLLLVASGFSGHVVFLMVIAGGLFASVKWFLAELKAVKASQLETQSQEVVVPTGGRQ
ncbi:hypothetical protein HDU76_008081, partial [Blyttiomyces sp. JEL0837]